jgi:hypothetical protein
MVKLFCPKIQWRMNGDIPCKTCAQTAPHESGIEVLNMVDFVGCEIKKVLVGKLEKAETEDNTNITKST